MIPSLHDSGGPSKQSWNGWKWLYRWGIGNFSEIGQWSLNASGITGNHWLLMSWSKHKKGHRRDICDTLASNWHLTLLEAFQSQGHWVSSFPCQILVIEHTITMKQNILTILNKHLIFQPVMYRREIIIGVDVSILDDT